MATPEVTIDDAARGTRSLDLWLQRTRPGESPIVEVAAIEVFDWFEDVGAALRDWDRRLAKVEQRAVARLTREHPPSGATIVPVVSGCWVVRATVRNRGLVRDHAHLFAAKFPGDARAWIDALGSEAPMPSQSGLLWAAVDGSRVFAARTLARTSRV